ncbi:hypothetical protein [Phyllobacterium sophorae]|uniref:hypothetical protein n=1 Tax=Phyllobacterium sophorae TaxID=1520277 RepID=UPI000D0EAC57|nr:hypothetical protein [Phyllobacterium sophorae]
MKARIIQTLHGEFITATGGADNLIAAMEVPDFALGLFNSDDHRQRAECRINPSTAPCATAMRSGRNARKSTLHLVSGAQPARGRMPRISISRKTRHDEACKKTPAVCAYVSRRAAAFKSCWKQITASLSAQGPPKPNLQP